MAEETIFKQVSEPLAEYEAYMERLYLINTLLGGTHAMREAGTMFLPKERGEEQINYEARLKRTVLLNAFKRTLQKLTGEVFGRKETWHIDMYPEQEKNQSPALKKQMYTGEYDDWVNNIDLAGTDLKTFSQNVFFQGIADGITHILIDFPSVSSEKTEAEAKIENIRPYAVHIKAKDLIGWRHEYRNGVPALTQIRIKESVQEPDGDFGVKTVDYVRVVNENDWQLWRKLDEDEGKIKDKDKWVLEQEGALTLGHIPLLSFIPGERQSATCMTAIPPLEDLANLNLCHWQSSSDQRNILHYARMIIWFGKNLDVDDEGQVKFGANRLIHSNSTDADLRVVEHSGAAIDAGRQDLKDLESQMALFGLTFMLPKQSGSITATEKAIDAAENESALKQWAGEFSRLLNHMFQVMADWKKQQFNGIIEISTDFRDFLDSFELDILLKAFQVKLLSRQIVFEEYKRRGLVDTEIDFIDMVAQLEDDQRSSSGNEFGNLAGSILGTQKEIF